MMALRSGLLAAEVASVDLSSFLTSLTGSITPAQVLTILGTVIGVGMSFFLMWLGVRKAVRAFTTAVQNGKIKIG